MTTVADLVVARAGDDGGGLRFEDRCWTWGEVAAAAAERAALLGDLRRPGPFHVGVLLENVPEYVFLLAGAALAGATVVGVNPTRRGEELAADIRHTDCQLLLTDAAGMELVDGLDLGAAAGRVLDVEGDAWRSALEPHRGAALPAPDQRPGPDDLFVLLFTSGSTAAPKAVRCSHGRLARSSAMGFSADDVLYCSMPLFHGNALFSNLVPGLAAGCTVVLRRRFSASRFLPDVRTHGVTFFNTVGRALSYILATPPTDHDRDHRLRFGLAPESSASDVEAFRRRFGCPVIEGYGSSEGVIALAPVPGAPPGALGRPVDGADIAVVDQATGEERAPADLDPDGRLRNPAEAVGEIVRRDAVGRFEGYWRNDEAQAARTRNGWFWSGDLGYRTADGTLFFAGRTADWLRVDGENFAAAPVERILGRHPDVAGVAVYAVADPLTGDQVMAAVELRPEADFDPDRFAAFLADQPDLGTKWAPRFVRVVSSLPVTATNKVDKQPLRRAAWAAPAVWWRPAPGEPFRPFTGDDGAELRRAFERHGRASFLPEG